jgi:hypothetical protein
MNEFTITLILILCAFTAGSVWRITRHAPIHCQYMVKVANKSGVYSCSQYPRPISVKK